MPRRYTHLSYAERILIQTQLTLGMKPSAIADGLGRSLSTILRELRRNGWLPAKPDRIAGGYRSLLADRRSRHLRPIRRLRGDFSPAARCGSPCSRIFARA